MKYKKSSGCQSEARRVLFTWLRGRKETGKSGQVSGTYHGLARAVLGENRSYSHILNLISEIIK